MVAPRSAAAIACWMRGLHSPRWRLEFRQFQIADDDRQQIVEVVGDAAGEFAERVQSLRLSQLRLGVFTQLHLPLQLRGPLVDAGFEFAIEPGELHFGEFLDW